MYKSLRSMLLMLACAVCGSVLAQDNLKAMQQKFVNEKFGMFIHFNMPSFVDEDWSYWFYINYSSTFSSVSASASTSASS